MKKLKNMKLDRTFYLELVVHHKDSTLCEFPSRFCVIRVPFGNIDLSQDCGIRLSLGQIRKLFSIGLFDDIYSYLPVGHRSFDKNYISQYPEFQCVFYDSCKNLYELYKSKL